MAPSHFLNQCWNIVNWTLVNNLQWNFNRNSSIFIQENAFENVVCKIASISSRPQCVKQTMFYGGSEVIYPFFFFFFFFLIIYPLISLLLACSPSHNDNTLYIEIYNCIGMLLSVLIQHCVSWWSGADKHQIICRHYVDIYHPVDIPLFKTNPNTTLNGNLCILSARLTTREKKTAESGASAKWWWPLRLQEKGYSSKHGGSTKNGKGLILPVVHSYIFNDNINPLRAKFFRENINIYLHFVSFIHIDRTQVLKILQVRETPTYSV